MPEVEYIKDVEKPNGRKISKGSRTHVTIKKAKQLEDEKKVIVVGSESNRNTQERTSKINDLTKSDKSKKDKK